MEDVQNTFNEDDIRSLVEEGVIENVQCEDECASDMEPTV